MDLSTLKSLIASYMSNASATALTPASFVIGGVDKLILAINAAHFGVQKVRDFQHASVTAVLSVASTGTDIAGATVSAAAVTLKKVHEVLLPVSDGYIPAEFLDQAAHLSRLKNAIGRQRYNASATMASLGVADDNPYAVQDGPTIYLYPAGQFTFPVAVRLDATRFMPDYTGPTTLTVSGSGTAAINTTWEAFGTYLDRPFFFNYQSGGAAPATVYAMWFSGTAWFLTPAANFGAPAAASRYEAASTAQLPVGLTWVATTFTGTLAAIVASGNVPTDFLLVNGWEYLQWAAILELNKHFKEFTNKTEGNVDEQAVEALKAEALQSLIAWDMGITGATTTPEIPVSGP